MRTTLDIDDDILQAAKELAEREKSTAGRVISALARRALSSSPSAGKVKNRGGIPVIPSRREIVNLQKIERLMDDEGV
jgi:hypothetical protein